MERFETTDYHTAGEPFRIVTAGAPAPPGRTVLERRDAARQPRYERIRRLLCHEPRGHAGMYGCFLVPPDDDGAHLGALFWHAHGYSTACGHGTMALGVWAVETGRVQAAATGTTEVVLDVPSGRVRARVTGRAGSVRSVAFRNVPARVVARRVAVATSAGAVTVDVADGGALYASLPAAAAGAAVQPTDLDRLVALSREIKQALDGSPVAQHPHDPRLSGIYGTIFHDDLGSEEGCLRQRNVTVFADGQVDRSPCGSGTCARVALLADEGRLDVGQELVHESIVGTVFRARAVEHVAAGLVVEVEGHAVRTGEHRFVLDPCDELPDGFLLG